MNIDDINAKNSNAATMGKNLMTSMLKNSNAGEIPMPHRVANAGPIQILYQDYPGCRVLFLHLI